MSLFLLSPAPRLLATVLTIAVGGPAEPPSTGEASHCAVEAAVFEDGGMLPGEVEFCGLGAGGKREEAEALRMMQRRGDYLLGRPSLADHGKAVASNGGARAGAPEAGTAASAASGGARLGCPSTGSRLLARWDVLGVAAWSWPEQHSPTWLFVPACVFASLPAAVAYGLPLLVGCGTAQVATVAAFWGLVWPAARSMHAAQQRHAGLLAGSCPEADAVALSHTAGAIAAHFYWMWGLLELVVRRKPLAHRIVAVTALGLLVLPIPWAQVLLRDLAPLEAVQDVLCGAVLGLVFFLVLHMPPIWHLLRASKAPLDDNLTTFWGGAIWPPERRLRQKQELAASLGEASVRASAPEASADWRAVPNSAGHGLS